MRPAFPHSSRLRLLLQGLILTVLTSRAVADDYHTELHARGFLQCVNIGLWECMIKTPIVTYINDEGVSISLVGAVHNADNSHYKSIQKELARHQIVLYEGWQSPGGSEKTERDTETESGCLAVLVRIVNFTITMVKSFLQFQHVDQWETIDYSSSRFVNADMTYRRFSKLCSERSEFYVETINAFKLFPRYVASAIRRGLPTTPEDFTRFLSLPTDWPQAFRYLYARELLFESNNLLSSFLVTDYARRTVTIHERNRLVMDSLKRQISEGKTRIAIYYGVVHIPDFEKRLQGRGFHFSTLRWVDCWKVTRLYSMRSR